MKRILALILIAQTALAGVTKPDRAITEFGSNIGVNPGAESGIAGWVASGGSLSKTTTAANVFEGNAAITWDASATSQTLTGELASIGGLTGTNGELTCMVQVPSGTSTHTLGVWNGTTLTNTVSVSNAGSTSYFPVTTNFVFGSSGSVTWKFTSAADEPSINVDKCYIGPPRNIGNVSQALIAGSSYFATTASCVWSRTSATLGDFTSTAACPAPVIEHNGLGTWSTTDADLPQQTITNLPAGRYEVKATFTGDNSTTNNVSYRISDGTTNSPPVAGNGTNSQEYVVIGNFNYTNAGDRTFKIQGASPATTVRVSNQDNDKTLRFFITYYPSSSQQAVSSANADYDWTSFTPTGTFTTNSTYTGKYRRVGEMMEVQTKIVFSGAPNSIGLSINIPSGFTIDTSKLVDSTSGNLSVGSGGFLDFATAMYPLFVTYNNSTSIFVSALNTTATYAVANSVTQALPFTVGSSDSIIIEYRVPIVGWSTNQRAPTLVGSVTSNSAGALRIESLGFGGNSSYSACTTGSCTIINPSTSGWATVSFSSTGVYTVNYSGAFSAPPICTATSNVASTSAAYLNVSSVPTTSSFTLNSYNGVTLLNGAGTIVCVGPR